MALPRLCAVAVAKLEKSRPASSGKLQHIIEKIIEHCSLNINLFDQTLSCPVVLSINAVSAKQNIADTSIKHQISGQSTSMVQSCMYKCWIR